MIKLSSSEEETTEFLISIWDKFKYLILLGVVLVVGGILVWESWLDSKVENQQLASDLYENFIDERSRADGNPTILANEIIKTFPDTLYADLVTFHLAKLQVDKSNFTEAEKYLHWILKKHSSKWSKSFDPIEVTARQRLARVLLANNKPEESLDLIKNAASLNNILYEIKGDALQELGLSKEARLSYLQAIESTQSQSIQTLLKMKLADLEIKN